MTTIRPSIPADRLEMPFWSAPVLAIGGLLFLIWFLSTGVSQIVVASLLISLGIVGVLLRPNTVIVATFIFLPLLGDVRRYISLGAGRTSNDPLILVAPAMAGMLFARLLFERRIRPDTPLAKLIVTLMVIMTLEIFNPLQGGITVGILGALYFLVPLLWFWIGRSTPTERVTRTTLMGIIPMVAIGAVALGLFQTYVGWLSFEAQWIREQASEFSALMVGDKIVRPFAFFTSPAEFAGYLSIALVCCCAPLFARRFTWTSLLVLPIGYMLFLASVRTAAVLTVVGLLVMWSAIGRDSQKVAVRTIFAVLIILPCIYLGLRRLSNLSSAPDRASVLKTHMFDGLLKPGESSAGGHQQEAIEGVMSGITNPIGYGLGATTMAAGKFGNGKTAGYEQDVANIFSSLGVGGGLLYVILMVKVLLVVSKVWTKTRSLIAMIVLGILVSQMGNWLTGNHYSTIALVWFLIGSIDRTQIPADPERSAIPRIRSANANLAHNP
jgi:hypothetical protein